MNKKGQFIALVFGLIVFLIVYAIFLSSFISKVSEMAMNTGAYTGVSAFFISNLNGIVIVSMIIGILWLSYAGTQ